MVPGGKGLAFIEFTDEVTAGTALAGLQGFKLTPTLVSKPHALTDSRLHVRARARVLSPSHRGEC